MATREELIDEQIERIYQLVNTKGREDFKKKFYNKFGTELKVISSSSEQLIEEIHDYCIRDILNKQAIHFYDDFVFPSVKDKLISDFIRMERYRRENQFDNFCLAMYQQVENIVNLLFNNNEFQTFLVNNKNLLTVLNFDKGRDEYVRKLKPLTLLLATKKNENPFNESFDKWFFSHKLKAILFCYCFQTELLGTSISFDAMYSLGNDLYQVRNLNHRGGFQSTYQQNIVNQILHNYTKYYLKFSGFLEQFVTSINISTFKI